MPKNGLPAQVLEQRRGQLGLVQPGDGVAEGADARQHDLVRLGDAVGIAADLGVVADLLERLLHAAQIGHAVIDNEDILHPLSLHGGNRKGRRFARR